MDNEQQHAMDLLQTLVGQPLIYGLKSPDTELYDIGFGEMVEVMGWSGKMQMMPTHALHILCRFRVKWKTGKHRVDTYYEDTSSKKFHRDVKRLIGLRVIKVELSDKNDLWIDLGDCRMVFATFEDGEESWRFLTCDKKKPHVVVSDSWISLDY